MKAHLSHGGVVRWVAASSPSDGDLSHVDHPHGYPGGDHLRGTHLLFALTLTFLIVRRNGTSGGEPPPWLDYALLALAVAPVLYLFVNYDYVVNRIYYIDDLTWTDMALATLLIVMIMEATRRVIGWALPITRRSSWPTRVRRPRGAHAAPRPALHDHRGHLRDAARGLGLLRDDLRALRRVHGAHGTGQLFMDFAMSLTGHTAGGPGKVSVVSSSLFGTISGSAVANVMVDGPIAIPLMKRTGFKPHFAAGVEAVASTGGQIMPPIMGAAAFVMAEFMQVSYGQVILWALIPAVLYYLACFGPCISRPSAWGSPACPGRAAAPRSGPARARAPVHPGAHDPRSHVFRLQRAAGGARGYARMLPVAALRASTRATSRCATWSRRSSTGAQRAARGARLRVRRHHHRRRLAHRRRHRLHPDRS
jgi:hypothetical protein